MPTDISAKKPSKLMVLVNVESAWVSKINWAQAVAAVVSLLTVFFGVEYDMAPEKQAMIVTGISMVQALITIVFRTYLTTTVTEQSVASTVETIPPVAVPLDTAKQIMVDAVKKKV